MQPTEINCHNRADCLREVGLAVETARLLDTQIISADSRQIYKSIPIVTAVPTEEERHGVRHHLLEMLPLEAYYSASSFESDAMEILGRIYKDRSVAVVCGGSMMYVDALCNGIDDIPTVPETVRMALMEEWRKRGDSWLLSELERLDPAHYGKVDLMNMKRVFHAVEVTLTAGKPYSSMLTGSGDIATSTFLRYVSTGKEPICLAESTVGWRIW